MKALLHPTYFPNLVTFACIAQHEIVWETADNFQKQTFRNRTHICTDRGRLMLNIPIKHVGSNQGRQKYCDVTIDNGENWQRQHWRTLETAYRTSPYFEYYEDEIVTLYEIRHESLMQFNLKSTALICECLQIEMPNETNRTFEKIPTDYLDLRFLVQAKKQVQVHLEPYNQVFGDRHGFVNNTSILDLLFNEGPNTLTYLKTITIDQLNA